MNFLLKNIAWVWSTVGSVVSAVSVLRLLQEYKKIELSGLMDTVVQYYGEMVSNFIDLIPLPFDWEIPIWYGHILIITAAFGAVLERTRYLSAIELNVHMEPSLRASMLIFVVYLLIPPVLVWQFIMDTALAIMMIGTGSTQTIYKSSPVSMGFRWIGTFIMMVGIVIAIIIFAYLTN